MTTIRPETHIAPLPARRVRRGPLTRKQILDASLKLFSEKGFARTSVRDIAQVAGITDAAIYYHFASKRDLFEALIEERGFTAAFEELERVEIMVGPREALPLMATGRARLHLPEPRPHEGADGRGDGRGSGRDRGVPHPRRALGARRGAHPAVLRRARHAADGGHRRPRDAARRHGARRVRRLPDDAAQTVAGAGDAAAGASASGSTWRCSTSSRASPEVRG